METNKTTLERAFELARSGECADMYELRRRLDREGFSSAKLSGPQLLKQLRELLRVANDPGKQDGSSLAAGPSREA